MMNHKPPTEHAQQVALCKLMDKAGIVYIAVPNGGKRTGRDGAAKRAEGMQKGAPDLLIFTRATNGKPTALELKRDARCRVADVQQVWLWRLGSLGWNQDVGYGLADAVGKLQGLGYDIEYDSSEVMGW
jgi:hypothetical protein